MRFFVLGEMDGDGCVYYRHGKDGFVYRVSFAGSRQMMEDLSSLFKSRFGFSSNIRRGGMSNGYSLSFSGSLALKLMNWMYDQPNTIYMARKYEKYKEIVAALSSSMDQRRDRTKEEVLKAKQIISYVA